MARIGAETGEDKAPRVRRVQKVKARREGWTAAKIDLFIETLAGTCNIAAALRKVKMSRSGLDKLRARNGTVRARIRDTLRTGYVNLELFVLEKVMAGTTRTVKKNGVVETVHEFPLALALQLLRLHRDAAVAADAPAPSEEDRAELVERLMRKMEGLRARMDREEEAARAAAAGRAPEDGEAAQ
ncbi:MAG TPA: hypothetical protein VEZ70_07435 [Allosphingosinicella sp.]|nr:hypothetical protein [Allosphingosinicella sp.]